MTLSLSRRAFALGLPTTALILGALPRVAGATAASAPTDAVTPLAQISIGRFTVTALSDGYGDMPFGYSKSAGRGGWERWRLAPRSRSWHQ